MRPLAVLDAPGGNLPPRVEQVPEPAHVQIFVPQPAVKALHVRVLRGLAWLDVNGVNVPLDAPGQEMTRSHLGPVVASNLNWRSTRLDDPSQCSRHAAAGHGSVHLQRQTLPRITIHDAEDSQLAFTRGHIAGQVNGPFLIRRSED